MPPRDVRMYLSEILKSAARIQRRTAGRSLEEYEADEDLRLIVERSFEIIGEALRHAINMEPELERSIAQARRIIDFRNILIHAYHRIDNTIVWDVIQTYLPPLRRQVQNELRTRGELFEEE